MLASPKKIARASLLAIIASTSVSGLVSRQTGSLTSGTYVMGAISVPGFNIGTIAGSLVGVANTSTESPATLLWNVTETDEGYVLQLAEGYAAVNTGETEVALVPSYPGVFWSIVPTEGVYTISTTNGEYGWILPHDAPEDSPLSGQELVMMTAFRAIITVLTPKDLTRKSKSDGRSLGQLTSVYGALPSGFYIIYPISTAGFPVGPVSGSLVGVQDSTFDPSDVTFAVIEYPEGYVLNLAAGNAEVSGDEVALVGSYPGTFWNIVALDTGFYAIETTDGSLSWILPHDAPVGTPVSLTAPGESLIPAQYFNFASAV
ncbi:hypothetical protein NM688_g1593 [Phlebia brevispora]|uniref:Uncharacterized protein n=1 Tax=Phlebia brevispora TaxID=194682 RepID=A0ACC1TAW4_9APHY|nr:hypothetical protein NM688_g1593 [Phlebia brevispora]